jgi:membrane protein YqaA with SNARE-associated domain
MSYYEELRKQKIGKEIRITSLIIISIIFIWGIYLAINYEHTREHMALYMQDYGLLAIFIFVFIVEFLPQILSPDYSLIWAIGLGMDAYMAVVVTMIASILGSMSAFLIGYHYGFHTLAPFFKRKTVEETLKFWDKHGKWFVLAAGTVPLPIPYFPLIFGALRMDKVEFILWGVIPRTLGFILTGFFSYYGFNGFFGLM